MESFPIQQYVFNHALEQAASGAAGRWIFGQLMDWRAPSRSYELIHVFLLVAQASVL
jgi:hypothetical protein